MSAPGPQTHNKVRTAHQSILKFKEEWEMKMAKQIARVKTVISRGLVTQHPVKLVGILALSVLLMTGTAVQFAPKSDGGPVNPSSVEKLQESPGFTAGESVKVSRINELSGETLRIREQLKAADRQEDYQEMVRYWDRLKRDAASGSTSYYDEDENERLYDELRQSFTGVPYNGSGREDLAVDRAGWPFGSLLPDTEYYRNPDFNDRQMWPSSK